MAEPAPSDSSPETDREFDPSADMLIHDYDDERTLEEEESRSNAESVGNELANLEKEGDMPIADLLAMYYGGQTGPPEGIDLCHDTRSSSEEEILSNQDLTLDKDEIARDLLKHESSDNETSVKELLDSVEMPSQTIRLLRSSSQGGSSDDDSEDNDYQPPPPDDDWKKTINVGSDYQAVVPQGLCQYDDAPVYENEDRLLWCPFKLEDNEVEKFLKDIQTQTLLVAQGVQSVPQGQHVRDDEQALYLLLQCGHNIEEASRRRKMQSVPPSDPMSLWSEEECRNFENGLKQFGKDFYLIQQNKVKTRSVGELVQFYYLWKKTERHDVFANKTRLEKKKYALHPGVTDYMDRFLDEQENPTPPRDRSSSPNINSLLYGDPKRHMTEYRDHPTDLDVALDLVQKVVDTNALALSPLKHCVELHHTAVGPTGPFTTDSTCATNALSTEAASFGAAGFRPIVTTEGAVMPVDSTIFTPSMASMIAKPLMPGVQSAPVSSAFLPHIGNTPTINTDQSPSFPTMLDGSDSDKRLKTESEWSANNSSVKQSMDDVIALPRLCSPNKMSCDVLANSGVAVTPGSESCANNMKDIHMAGDNAAMVTSPVITKEVVHSSDKLTNMTIGLSGVNASLKTAFSSVRDSSQPMRSVLGSQMAESAVQ